MTGSGNATEPPNTGYEGWAVIDLEAQTVIHLNQRAHVLLGNKHSDLPAKLSTFLTATDLALLTDRALPAVMGGVPWQGGLRVGEHRVDMAPKLLVSKSICRRSLSPHHSLFDTSMMR